MEKTNEELIREYKETSRYMAFLSEKGKYAERNAFVPRIHELNNLIDWGIRKGDKVERRTGRGWEVDVVLDVKGSEIHFRTMIVPPSFVRPFESPTEEVIPEQNRRVVLV